MIYVDTSAALKAIIAEPETPQVREILSAAPSLVSSRLLAVELHAVAARRVLPAASITALLDGISLVSLDDDVAQRAIDLRSGLRSLDALHLATATRLAPVLTGVLTYDTELRTAAEARSLPVLPAVHA